MGIDWRTFATHAVATTALAAVAIDRMAEPAQASSSQTIEEVTR